MPLNLLPEGGEAYLYPAAVPDADACFRRLNETVAWRQETARIMGRALPLPRLTAWYGDAAYAYSGIANPPQPWCADLLKLKDIAERHADAPFNAVLLNLYRDGRDSVAWHRDAEATLGSDPIVASISLGAVRRFKLRHARKRDLAVDLDLKPGSLLVMGPGSQVNWQHALPKTARAVGPRINLTFRFVFSPSSATRT